jgi:hypothetical protein
LFLNSTIVAVLSENVRELSGKTLVLGTLVLGTLILGTLILGTLILGTLILGEYGDFSNKACCLVPSPAY